jgi:hypothetical protein
MQLNRTIIQKTSHTFYALLLLVLATTNGYADNPSTNKHDVCTFPPVTKHETDKDAIIYVSAFSAGQNKLMIPYNLGRTNITLSASSGVRTSGHHTYITTFNACSCGKTSSEVKTSPSDVNPETYTWNLAGNIPGLPKNGYKDSYSEQVVISESGLYSVDTYFKGTFSCGCPEVTTPAENLKIDCFKEAKIIELKAIDASTSAGVRESTECLKMVRNPSNSCRKATINLKTSGNVANGWPQWTGVASSPGSYTVNWESTLSIDGQVGAEIKGMCDESDSKSVGINVVEEQLFTYALDKKKIDKFVGMLNVCLALICEPGTTPITPDLQMNVKQKRVDFYNDGGKIGDYWSVGGKGSIALGSAKGKKSFPTSLPAVNIEIGGEFNAFYFAIAGDFEFDQSKSNPWVASAGSLSAGAEIKGYIAGVAGVDAFKVVAKGEISSALAIKGTLQGKGNSVVANATMTVPSVKFTATLDVIVRGVIEWKMAKYEGYTFGSCEEKSGDVVIWSK